MTYWSFSNLAMASLLAEGRADDLLGALRAEDGAAPIFLRIFSGLYLILSLVSFFSFVSLSSSLFLFLPSVSFVFLSSSLCFTSSCPSLLQESFSIL